MKALITCTPGLGHFHPIVPLARALRAAGHDVAVVTSPSFRPWIERAGLPIVTAGADWTESEPELAFPDLEGSPRELDGLLKLITAAFYRAGAQLIPDLLQLVDTTRPDLLIHEQEEFTTPLVAERAGIPWATVGLCYRLPLGNVRGASDPWNQARAGLGLELDPGMTRLWPYLFLDSYPPSMHPVPIADSMKNAFPLQPVAYEAPGDERSPLPDTLPDRPTVYVTMGTIFNRVQGIFAAILDALADEPVNVIVTVGTTNDPEALRPFPRNAHVLQYIPQSDILPRADLVVSHCGRSTMLAALAHGLPSLALPLGSDQFYNAFRLVACGAGLSLDRSHRTPDEIRATVHALLGEPIYRLNARRLAREIEAMPTPAVSVPLLEKLARERTPLNRS
jgi:UDP:flavonoid glycosyltransferase YjiC (YdhE family)